MSRFVTLAMNPALDLSTTVGSVAPFSKLRCSRVRRDPGGGGINVARILCRLGGAATAIYPIGGSAGARLKKLVDGEGVESLPITIANDTREDFTVFETETKKQYRFVAPGPEVSEEEYQACLDAFMAASAGADYSIISGSLPPGVPISFFANAARIARESRIHLALDTTTKGLETALRVGVSLIKSNEAEFTELAGAHLIEPIGMARAAREFVMQEKVGAIAVTLAGSGAILVTKNESWLARAPKVEAESTVGTGDSFLGALVWCRTESHAWRDALRFAVAAGSAALLSPGTDLAQLPAIHRLLPDVMIEDIS